MTRERENIVNGWQVRATGDGGFGVFDDHGMLAGPFGAAEEAMAAALKLPCARSASSAKRPPDLSDVEPGSDADETPPVV